MAPLAGSISAIEINPDAIADAAVNLADTEDVSLYEGAVEEVLPLLASGPELLLVDPPEAGLSRVAVSGIASLKPERVIYVSEDVATLARDGRQLANQGYSPVEVQPLDMYPQTYQVLTVSLWKRAK